MPPLGFHHWRRAMPAHQQVPKREKNEIPTSLPTGKRNKREIETKIIHTLTTHLQHATREKSAANPESHTKGGGLPFPIHEF